MVFLESLPNILAQQSICWCIQYVKNMNYCFAHYAAIIFNSNKLYDGKPQNIHVSQHKLIIVAVPPFFSQDFSHQTAPNCYKYRMSVFDSIESVWGKLSYLLYVVTQT